MEDNKITFGQGIKEYSINGKCTVAFNPADGIFAEKLYNAFDRMEKMQDGYKAQISKMGNKREIFDVARKLDQEMRVIIDEVFDAPVCDAVFGSMSVYALADGLPAWVNLMLAVMDEINESISEAQTHGDERLKKYLSKYKRKG